MQYGGDDDQAVPGYSMEVEVGETEYVRQEDEGDRFAFSLQFNGEKAQPTNDSRQLWGMLSDGTKKELQTKMSQINSERQNSTGLPDEMKDVKNFIPEIDEAIKADQQKLSVKRLRKIIPVMRILVYMNEQQYHGKKKLKHLWDEKPANWSGSVPFVDPNNGTKTGGKVSKPGKTDLLKMFTFLKDKYKHWCYNGRLNLADVPLYVPKKEKDEGSPRRSPTPSPKPFVQQTHREESYPFAPMIDQTDPATSLLNRVQLRFDQILGLGRDNPNLESLSRIKKLIESLFIHNKRNFLTLGHEMERLFDELFMMDTKQEDWSKFIMDCKDLLDRWLSSLVMEGDCPPKPQVPREVLACHAGEVTAEAPIQNRLIPYDGPYLPQFLLSDTPANETIIQKEPQTTSVATGRLNNLSAGSNLGIELRKDPLLASQIGNTAKQSCDVNQKGQDTSVDNQNFKLSEKCSSMYEEEIINPMWCSSNNGSDEDLQIVDYVLALESGGLQHAEVFMDMPPKAIASKGEFPDSENVTYTLLEAVPQSECVLMVNDPSPVVSGEVITDQYTQMTSNNQVFEVRDMAPLPRTTIDTPSPSTRLHTAMPPTTTHTVLPPTTIDTAMLDNFLQAQGMASQELSGDMLRQLVSLAQRSPSRDSIDRPVLNEDCEIQIELVKEPNPVLSNVLLPTTVEEMDCD